MMTKRRAILAAGILAVLAALQIVRFAQARGERDGYRAAAEAEIGSIAPISLSLVDEAIMVLSQGWQGMSEEEKAAFVKIFDPAGTGDVDEDYVAMVLSNYQKIHGKMEEGLAIVYAAEGDMCEGKRLYYTDLVRLYVCPYFFEEGNELRKARTLIHEMAHAALFVADRPYYRPTSRQYAQLTPEGSWPARLPVIGRLLREVLRDDTLYHPDAYAHFALLGAGYVNIYAPEEQAVVMDS